MSFHDPLGVHDAGKCLDSFAHTDESCEVQGGRVTSYRETQRLELRFLTLGQYY